MLCACPSARAILCGVQMACMGGFSKTSTSGMGTTWIAVVGAVILLAPPGFAKDRAKGKNRSTVVLVSTGADGRDPLLERARQQLKEELEYGLALNAVGQRVADNGNGGAREMLTAVAAKMQVASAVRISRPVEEIVTVEIVTINGSGEARFNTFDVEVSPTDDVEETIETIVFRIVDVIQLEIVDGPIDPPPDKRHVFRITACFEGEYSPGKTGFFGGPAAGGSWLPQRWLSIGVDTALLVVGSDIRNSGAAASLDMLLARLKVAYEASIGRRFTAAAGIGAGVGYMWTKGTGSSDTVVVKSDRTALIYVGGFGEMRLVLTKTVWIPLTLNIGALPPGVKIHFEETKVASVGLPIIEVGLGVTFNFDLKE
jgi:hypothetical protein